MSSKIHPAITLDLVIEAYERASSSCDNPGFCIACGEETKDVEPDACNYECPCCRERAVFGAEELLLRLA